MLRLANAKPRHKTFICSACGRSLLRRTQRQQFCSDRCRVWAHREKSASRINARTAIKNSVLGQDTGPVTLRKKSTNKINGLQGRKIGSSPFQNAPLNLLGGGGWHWPDSPRLDAQTLANILRCEIGAAS